MCFHHRWHTCRTLSRAVQHAQQIELHRFGAKISKRSRKMRPARGTKLQHDACNHAHQPRATKSVAAPLGWRRKRRFVVLLLGVDLCLRDRCPASFVFNFGVTKQLTGACARCVRDNTQKQN